MTDLTDALARARRTTPAHRAALMVPIFADLEKVVGRLLLAYEANDELNSEQPEFAQASYACSIDEWLGCVTEGKRQWQELAGPQYLREFPGFDADGAAKLDSLLRTGAWEDISWHNDACPSITCDVFELYVDFADDAKREFAAEDLGGKAAPRFSMHCEGEVMMQTDDWADVLRFINEGWRP